MLDRRAQREGGGGGVEGVRLGLGLGFGFRSGLGFGIGLGLTTLNLTLTCVGRSAALLHGELDGDLALSKAGGGRRGRWSEQGGQGGEQREAEDWGRE